MKDFESVFMDASPEFRDGFNRAIVGMDRMNEYPLFTQARRDWFRGWATGSFVRSNLITIISYAVIARPNSPIVDGIIDRATRD